MTKRNLRLPTTSSKPFVTMEELENNLLREFLNSTFWLKELRQHRGCPLNYTTLKLAAYRIMSRMFGT